MTSKTDTPALPTAALYYREGSSDKVYHAAVEPNGGGFIVTFAYGRRGSTLTTGTKTQSPVPLEDATRIFNKLVAEKTGKGYQRSDGGANPVRVPVVAKTTAPAPFLPQLLNPLPEEQLPGFIARIGSQWCAQQKYDGKRIILQKEGAVITAYNRKGIACGASFAVIDYATKVDGDWVMDGEMIGDDYFAFDLLTHHHVDLRSLPYGERHKSLLKIIGGPNGWPIHPVPLYTGAKAVQKFVAELRAKNAEGVVFKDLLASYTPGRPNSGGAQLKCKFCATCSAVVINHNDARSVGLALYTTGEQGLAIGNVTIPPNHKVPAVGAVVEIRYLYAYQGGSLYQPVYLGERDDVEATDCTVEKQPLKYKADSAEDAE